MPCCFQPVTGVIHSGHTKSGSAPVSSQYLLVTGNIISGWLSRKPFMNGRYRTDLVSGIASNWWKLWCELVLISRRSGITPTDATSSP